MADGLSWFFELVDRVSAPAKGMTEALHGTSKAFKEVEDLVEKGGILRQWQSTIGTVFGKGAGDAVGNILNKGYEMVKNLDKVLPLDTLKQLGGGLVSAGSMLAGFVADLGLAAAAAAGAAAVAVAGVAAVGFKMAAEAADAKRTMLLSLQTQLGAAADAGAFLDKIEGFAKLTAFQKDAFTGFAKELLGAGFKDDELKPLLGALSDMQAEGGAAKAQQLMSMLTKIKATERVGRKDLAGLSAMGISDEEVFSALAEQRAITLEQARTLFEGGKLKSNDALNAILAAIQKQSGGVLGAKGQELEVGSLSAQLQHLSDAWGDLFENVDIKPITDFLNKLNDALGGPIGERFGATIDKAFAAVAKLFNVDGSTIESTLEKVADGFEATVDWTIRFAAAVKDTWTQVEPALSRLEQEIEILTGGDMAGASIVWTNLAFAFEAFVGTIVANLWVFEQLAELKDSLFQIGADIVTGLWEGIRSGWEAMLEKFHELVALLPDSARKILGIQSPSTVFADLGMQTGRGFSVGLDASDIPGSINAALAPPPSPTLGSLTAGAFASSGGNRIEINLNFTIEGGGDDRRARELAEEVKSIALPAIIDALEELRIESGG